jgi:hypothetical protein
LNAPTRLRTALGRGRGSTRRLLPALAVLVALVGLPACSSDDPYPANDPAWLRGQEQELLDQRVKAVRTRDLDLVLHGVAKGDRAFVARQRRDFANLVQLPLARFEYRVLRAHWPEQLADPGWGRKVQLPRVQEVVQLAGYDTAPVRQTTGFAFGYRNGELRIVSDRTRTGAEFPGYEPAPWDVAAVRVHQSEGVLGVFDRTTDADAARVLDVVRDGVRDVRKAVPFQWPGRVVVYSFQNRRVLDSFAGVPGGNIRHLGALTFPVYAEEGGGTAGDPVGMRFTLLPSSLRAGPPFLGRIVRHGLTHVAVGERDDGAPVWFAEGLAEYVGARPLPRTERRIASVALDRARGRVTAMPRSATFNGPDQDWHYALAWMACDYIAASQGEARLWELMDALHDDGAGTRDGAQDAVLVRVLGFDSHELARRAAARIRTIYG